ncbi:MAG: hypothetical protein IPI73_17535 [Betaproteobacteria bacterium]|nr:hypothetical protein [Betaproteobacteria bacterium]
MFLNPPVVILLIASAIAGFTEAQLRDHAPLWWRGASRLDFVQEYQAVVAAGTLRLRVR